MNEFLVLFVAAVLCEGVVEYLVAPWFDYWKTRGGDETVVQQALRSAAAGVGVLVAWQLQLLFFRSAFELDSLSPWFDIIITGIAIGRGSNYIHDLIGQLRHEF